MHLAHHGSSHTYDRPDIVRFLFLGIFGLLPIWAVLIYFLYALATMRSDLAFTTLMLLLGAIPLCAITLGIAGGTLAAGSMAKGNKQQKSYVAIIFFACSILAVASYGMYEMHQRDVRDKRSQLATEQIKEYATGHPAVIAAVGSVVAFDSLRTGYDPSGLAFQYEVFVHGARATTMAIVKIDKLTHNASLELGCTKSRQPDGTEVASDKCAK